MTRQRTNIITLGILLSLFLSSMEGTVVSTAMPTIVGQLGGLSIYSWVFSVFMLASTTTVPIYGKLSDIYGRKLIYTASMFIFVVGSILCGMASSMEQLILFRAIQGIGAGGVLPLAFTIVGELFSLEQRARMQGVFSAVWGISSIIGPLIGGFLVDQVSWHWVFLINIFPGVLAMALVWFAWVDTVAKKRTQVSIDFLGAGLLTAGALILLLGLNELGNPLGWGSLVVSIVLFAGLIWAERRAVDPILPLHLFRDRLFNVAILHGILAGWAMFGSLSYVPLFVQAVLGTSATQAGITLTPMSLCWTAASVVGAQLLLKMGYRTLSLIGMVLLVFGAFMMSQIGVNSSQWALMLYTGLMGIGMGFSIPAFLIAVQSTVKREELGVATSTVQFSRNIGGTVGVSVLGVALSTRLNQQLQSVGIDPTTVSLNALLDPVASASATLEGPLRQALAVSIASIFIISFVAAIAALLAVMFAPGGKISQLMKERAMNQTPEI